jgi:hypothetical protein
MDADVADLQLSDVLSRSWSVLRPCRTSTKLGAVNGEEQPFWSWGSGFWSIYGNKVRVALSEAMDLGSFSVS